MAQLRYCRRNEFIHQSSLHITIEPLTRGTLDQLRHLLSIEEHANAENGSVYVRSDGCIFDYELDTVDPAREPFDTGHNIYDLERTGRYAPTQGRRTKKSAGESATTT